MNKLDFLVRLDQLSSSYSVILFLMVIAVVAGVLFKIGLIGWGLSVFASLVRNSIRHGFQLWERLFAWASWPLFLVIISGWLIVGWVGARYLPALTIVCALVPLFMGVTACLAYMMIDLERYAVARGHKAIHNPLKGQGLAVNLVRYGHAVGVPLLISAMVGTVGGFALLNLGLYETIGKNWYAVKAGQAEPTYVDFVANALIVLLKIVDVLDFARASHVLDVAYVRQVAWPSTTLVSIFRMFFTLVLLQQVFASLRQGHVLSETITDLWNPNEPIHERARHALPQYGSGAVGPLLISLGSVTSLTKEQREHPPLMLAAIGPAAIPSLVRHLRDPHEHVRAIAAASLGHLRVRGSIVLLVPLSRDPSDIVRQSLIDALGIIASDGSIQADTKLVRRSLRLRIWRSLKWERKSIAASPIEPIGLAVKTLQAALVDDSLSVRAHAARALGQIGPAAVVASPDLIALLKDADESVRWEAIEALCKVGGPTAAIVDALVQLLQDASPALRCSAARQLGTMQEVAAAAFPALVPLLQDREDSVREAAAEAIGQIGCAGDQAVEGLIEGLSNPDSVVRAQTAEALGTIGESAQETAPALVDALRDRNDLVRAKAVEALGRIGESVADVAVPGLVRALRDQDNVVSSLAAEALGEMGESADVAIPSLIRSLQHINADVRASAAESLGKLDADSAGAPRALERACEDDDADVRSRAIQALSMIDEPTGITMQAILTGLQDADAQVRTSAVEALCQWGHLDESSLNLLLTLLEDANEQVRLQVTKVLPLLAAATPAVIEGLCRRLREDTDLVQAQAAQALGQFGPSAAVAGGSLLRAAQTGEASVRVQAANAIGLIQPSEILAAMCETEIEPGLIDALREIETQIRTSATDGLTNLIPIIVVGAIDPESGRPIDVELSVELIPSHQAAPSVQEIPQDINPNSENAVQQ